MEKSIKYLAKGHVLGTLWGGGKGAYPTEVLQGKTLKEIVKSVKQGLKDGSLDSGMGFESLQGAIMKITKVTEIILEGKTFTNKESEIVFVGDLDKKEKDFLENCVWGA